MEFPSPAGSTGFHNSNKAVLSLDNAEKFISPHLPIFIATMKSGTNFKDKMSDFVILNKMVCVFVHSAVYLLSFYYVTRIKIFFKGLKKSIYCWFSFPPSSFSQA